MIFPAFIAAAKTTFHGKVGLTIASSLWLAFSTVAVTEAIQGQIIVAIITATPPTAAVIVAMIAMMKTQKSVITGQQEMHKQMNSRLDELVEAKRGVARAEGVEQERSEERERKSKIR